MSLIFKALQRVGQNGSAPADGGGISPPQQAQRRWRRWLGSPVVVMAMAAGIFISGILASHGVNVLSARSKQLTPVVAAAYSSQPSEPSSQLPSIQATVWEPASAGSQTPTVTDPATVSHAAADPDSPTPVETDRVRFYPAGDQAMPAVAESPLNSGSSVTAPVPQPGSDLATNRLVAQLSKDRTTAVEAASIGDRAAVSEWVPAATPLTAGPADPEMTPATDPSTGPTEAAGKGFPQIDHKRQSAQATRHRKISRLAHNVLSAIKADDTALSAELIRQLARIKGPQNDFVLKLKAYSLIRQERLDEARTLLTRVLAHSADDLEAGLNMAVIEIKSGRYDQARARLTQLQKRYPEKARIGQYLAQLPRR